MNWSVVLLHWYKEHKREFPWRMTKDPYRIWLSEIILQQTRVEQGRPYYLNFISTYPTVNALAAAEEEAILKLWQGLGYYSRARNLHYTARYIVEEYGGKFPTTFEELIKLKGVGDYTASAIASICYGQPQAVVDGNVYRFLSRFFGITTPIDHSSAHREFKTLANLLMGEHSPGKFNQALMEFGALQCTPKKANCSSCVFSQKCLAYQQGKVEYFPIKSRKIKVRRRYFNYLVLVDPKNNSLMKKRSQNGIWQNLYEFPLIETYQEASKAQIQSNQAYDFVRAVLPTGIKRVNSEPIKHRLSHQELCITFWKVELAATLSNGLSLEEINQLPVPVVVEHFIEKHL